jgi:hypothetical protein
MSSRKWCSSCTVLAFGQTLHFSRECINTCRECWKLFPTCAERQIPRWLFYFPLRETAPDSHCLDIQYHTLAREVAYIARRYCCTWKWIRKLYILWQCLQMLDRKKGNPNFVKINRKNKRNAVRCRSTADESLHWSEMTLERLRTVSKRSSFIWELGGCLRSNRQEIKLEFPELKFSRKFWNVIEIFLGNMKKITYKNEGWVEIWTLELRVGNLIACVQLLRPLRFMFEVTCAGFRD